jgi:hypothetical protein
MDTVWGGLRYYSNDKLPALFAALHKFIGQPTDPKAAIIFVASPAINATTVGVYFFYGKFLG